MRLHICSTNSVSTWGFVFRLQYARNVDDHQPGFVECRFLDAAGQPHVIIEKLPVVSVETLRNFRIVRGEPRDYLLYAIIPPAEPTVSGTALPQPATP